MMWFVLYVQYSTVCHLRYEYIGMYGMYNTVLHSSTGCTDTVAYLLSHLFTEHALRRLGKAKYCTPDVGFEAEERGRA